MTISSSEQSTLSCPSCGSGFDAEVWTLIDAGERPDLAQALRDGALNVVACPHCGYQGPAGAPLLFHDPAVRRVHFAVPPGVEEYTWREQAQALLYQLVGSLPEDARLPYLGDVKVDQEVEGVRRALLREQRRRGAASRQAVAAETQAPAAPPIPSPADRPIPPSPPDEPPSLLEAMQALLAADNDEEFAATVAAHPALLGGEADADIRQLAEAAYNDGQRDVADALHELRRSLARIRSGADDRPHTPERRAPGTSPAGPESAPAEAGQLPALDAAYQIGDVAYQRLLRVATRDELFAVTRDYPALLEEWADAELAERAEAALDEGNERLAGTIEERREALAALRAEVGGQAGLARAVQALMEAGGEEDIAHTLDEHPILLTDAAQDALLGLAAGARAQGDDELADYTIERRSLLRKVRAGLEAS